ncbi:MAG: hypothetical protein Q8K89_04825, partial [Actinomycetota bacterium]|nr:hypothetical protein [Actinomycetota bacterium]
MRAAVVAGVMLALVLVGGLVLYSRGGGPVPRALTWLGAAGPALLESSGPDETVLRTLRLAGIEHAVVGESSGTAVVRLALPSVSSAADVELG